jgi:hypothetical protein
MNHLHSRLLAAAAVIALALPLQASSPKFFQAATQTEFLKGDVENLTIDSRGELSLGPAAELIYESAAPFLWTIAAQPDGQCLSAAATKARCSRSMARAGGQLFLTAPNSKCTPWPRRRMAASTSAPRPTARSISSIGTARARHSFRPTTKYIWALAVDAKGNVYAGTGDKGVIYKISPDGKGAPFYKTNATHATALAFDKNGNLLVGTGTPGKVLRIDPDGKPFVLLDSPFQEIRSLRFDDRGALYVAALNGRGSSGGSPTTTETNVPDRARSPASAGPVGVRRNHFRVGRGRRRRRRQ